MSEKLYSLLPTVYRTNDAYNDEPLRGLMKVLESEYSRLDEDVAQLYDNWFIETCEEWVVPYIADLFGLKGVTSSDNASMRAFVSNTIAYRRRKGTPQVLEELARDLLNRPVRIQEFFSLLSHTQHLNHLRLTQHLNHLRLSRTGTCKLRDPDVVRRVDGAFDSSMHIVDVRRPGVGRGRHNLPNLGLSVWRLESFPIERCDADLVKKGCYTFDPFGRDVPLFNRERTQFNAFEPMLESDAPSPLHRRQLEEELWALVAGLDDTDGVYFGMQPVFEIFLDGSKEAVLPEDMCIADLSVWRRPEGGMKVAIDPALGRITVEDGVPSKVQATHAYGSPGDIGGGPYFERPADEPADDWRDYLIPGEHATIEGALQAIGDDGVDQARVIVDTNETFDDGPLNVDGVDVQIIAANGMRPCIKATINANAEKVTLRGLWIQGKIEVGTGVHELTVTDCTVLNGTDPALSVPDPHDTLRVEIESCALGPCSISSDAEMFSIRDSIVHAGDAEAIAGPDPPGAPPLSVERCTILGSIATKQLELLSESIVTGKITVERTQIGCARFSWVRPGSRTPRRYRCQPDMEIDRLTALSNNEDRSPHVRPATLSTRPRFQSTTPGQPAFGQLGLGCPDAVRYGAKDEGEMGCWHKLYEQERYLNLRSAIGEYVRFGLDYGIIERT